MSDTRDIQADYIKAYLAEYESYQKANDPRADDVVEALRGLGHEIKRPEGVKERAVPEPLEKAVEADTPPKRRGRPPVTSG